MASLKNSIVLLLALVLSSCTTSPSSSPPIGSKYRYAFNIGTEHMQIPLPPGEWTLASLYQEPNEEFQEGFLLKIENNRVIEGIIFEATTHPTIARFGEHQHWLNEVDDNRTHHIEKQTYFHGGGEKDIWSVRTYAVDYTDTLFKDAKNYLKSQNIQAPESGTITIDVVFLKANPQKYLLVYYLFNPQNEGFSSQEPWGADSVSRNPQQKAYIQRLVDWAYQWKHKIDKGFERALGTQ